MPQQPSLENTDPSSQLSGDLYEKVYQELRRLAQSQMSREYVYSTLQGTALVHEAWLRLGGDEQPEWRDKRQLFAAASEAMRRILVERARKRSAKKYGGEYKRAPEEELLKVGEEIALDDRLIQISDALEKFNSIDPRKAELVRLRYIFGLTFEEVADTMGISLSTARRWWTFARSWLYREISPK